jgi:Protein of unknown function (DUF2867)
MEVDVRLPDTGHTSQPWRIHDIAPDFSLEDVWALPVWGAREDFPRLVEGFARGSERDSPSFLTRALFAIRWKLGELVGWDDPERSVGSRVPTLRERLPADLREGPCGPDFDALPFRSLYMLENEFAAEIANATVHGLLHLGWVSDVSRGYRGQMAVLVKPNGVLGNAYMAAIRPFRHLIVYPALMRQIEHQWREWAAEVVATR